MKAELILWGEQTDVLLIPETAAEIGEVQKLIQTNRGAGGLIRGKFIGLAVGTLPGLKISLSIFA